MRPDEPGFWHRSWRRLAVPTRRHVGLAFLVIAVGCVVGLTSYEAQEAQNHVDAEERFVALSNRVTREITERLQRYEYGLRAARGMVVASDGQLTREAFAKFSNTWNLETQYPGARGFGIILRVHEGEEASFIAQQRRSGQPDFSIRTLESHRGDRFVLTLVEPVALNGGVIGLDIGSEERRRDAALEAAVAGRPMLTAPITLVQANLRQAGGLLLLLPIYRREGQEAETHEQLLGWSYTPLLIEDILKGLDLEESHFVLSLRDLDDGTTEPFYVFGAHHVGIALLDDRVRIPIYGRRWEADFRATSAFMDSLHQPSPLREGVKGFLLGAAVAGLLATLLQLMERTRGQRLEQARRAAIVEGSSDAVIVQSLDGTITDWNDGAVKLFGYAAEEVRGHSATELLLPPDLEEEDTHIRGTVAKGERVQLFDTQRRARDGSLIPVSITASPIRDSSGAVVGSAQILRDIRAAKAAEQHMREMNASLESQVRERTARLALAMSEAREASEAKSRFLANMSHEIRTPLNAVIGLSHLLERTQLDAQQGSMVARIRSAGRLLLALLNDILDLSKIEAGEMVLEQAPFSVEAVVAQVASIMSVAAEQQGIEFVLDAGEPWPGRVLGDSVRVGQILTNLVSNAIKFTPQGSVALALESRRLGESRMAVTVRVTDTGVGIAPEVQGKLFQPFVQADASTTRRFGGTGLGLSIVRQLVELMHGRITLTSALGQGSCFEVALEFELVGSESEIPSASRHEHRAAPALQGVSVLVVDDNALNREVAERILLDDGAIVSQAANGEEALLCVSRPGQAIRVVLMDVQMPVMDGLEATRRLRARSTPVRVIGLTAGTSAQERSDALAAGMDAILGKPYEPDALIDTIAQCLQMKSPVVDTLGDQAGTSSVTDKDDEGALSQPQLVAHSPSSAPACSDDAEGDDWPSLPGLDVAMARQRLHDDRGLMARMLAAVRQHLLNNRQDLNASNTDDGETWAASRAAAMHDLKGMAGTLAAAALREAASQAEAAIKSGDRVAARRALAAVDRVGEPFVACAWTPRGRPLLSGAAAAAPPSAEVLIQLQRQLQDRDLAALGGVDAQTEALAALMGSEAHQAFTQAVAALDFQAALTVLSRWLPSQH